MADLFSTIDDGERVDFDQIVGRTFTACERHGLFLVRSIGYLP